MTTTTNSYVLGLNVLQIPFQFYRSTLIKTKLGVNVTAAIITGFTFTAAHKI